MRPVSELPVSQMPLRPSDYELGEPIDFTDLEDVLLWREASDALGLDFRPLDSDGVQYL